MSRLTWLHFLVALVVSTQVAGDECRPSLLWNVAVSDDYVLSWQPSPEEPCDILYYLVSIRHNVNGSQYEYAVTEQSLSLDFLPVCESVRIQVLPVSTDNIQGHGVVIHKILPLPAEADLTIQAIGVTQEEDTISLDWIMDPKWENCAKHYRLLIYNRDSNTAVDRYFPTNSALITDVLPCTVYSLQITPMYNVETPGPHLLMGYTGLKTALPAPKLENVSAGSSSVNMTWSVLDISKNRCQLTSLIVDGSPSFNRTFPLSDQTDRASIPIEITELQPDQLYLLTVRVENVGGVSSPTRLAIQTHGTN